MVLTLTPSTDRAGSAAARTPASRHGAGFLSELEGQHAFGHITPNWYASVMGTGIVANAAATLPVHVPGLIDGARVVWGLDLLLIVVVTIATAVHLVRHPARARAHLADPVMSHFYGAPAMALMTVGAGAMLVGRPVIGDGPALGLDVVLWTVGTLLGLWTAVAIPYRAFTEHDVRPESASGGWLMPVVPPMVSAATGTLLIPHLPTGEARTTLLAGCYAMFGLTLIASLVMITLIWNRLVQHKVGAAAAVPTLWIVLGPLGQSITAAHNLGEAAPDLLPAPYGTAFHALGLVYGLPVWGFAMLWAALALAVTVRTARGGLPFSLTWWSFTFPVGTVVTGTSGLAAATGLHLFGVLAVVFYATLVSAWLVVAVRTFRGAWTGRLLRPAVRAGA